MSAAEQLLIERHEHVVTLTLNRPGAKNAFGLEMLARLADAWEMVDADDDVRAVVLTGAGGDFCAGADLKLMHGDQSDNPWHKRFREDSDLHWRALLRHYSPKKPVIAACEGIALGGGTEILQGTDIRVAAEGALFGVTECRWGLFPLGGSTVRLARQIPYTIAMDLLLTGRRVKAQEAKEIGLVGHVVPDGEALGRAQEIALRIAENGPLAVQAIKRSVKEGLLLNERDALKLELDVGSPIFATEDAKEGPRSFAEKRKPRFVGR